MLDAEIEVVGKMLENMIPVCAISKYNRIIGTIYYDVSRNRFLDKIGTTPSIVLPVQDFISCEVSVGNLCTVVGRAKGKYVVCFGDDMLHLVTKGLLLNLKVSNLRLSKDRRFLGIGKLQDLSNLFPDSSLIFQGYLKDIQSSSLGVAKKFTAIYNGNPCVVKFSKIDGKDLVNELSYYEIAKILKIPCCRVFKGIYYGEPCIISMFKYMAQKDVFRSFKSLGGNVSQIYSTLSESQKFVMDRMLLLDYILGQQDRHYSNIALLNGGMYPLFDNGDSLGIGSIGWFSKKFRLYIERKNPCEIQALLGMDARGLLSKLNSVTFYDKGYCIPYIKNNLRVLGLL